MNEIIANRLVTINVDVQNDFCSEGSLAVDEGDMVIPPLNLLNAFTRRRNGLVIFTGDQHPVSTRHFDTWPVHCVAGTKGAQFRQGLDIHPEDIIIDKGMGQTDGYSGFEGITKDGRMIEDIIRPRSNESVAVVIGGLATDYCVLNTVLDALAVAEQVRQERLGSITVFAICDAMRAVSLQLTDGDMALQRMQEAGAIMVDSIDILQERAFALAA